MNASNLSNLTLAKCFMQEISNYALKNVIDTVQIYTTPVGQFTYE